MSRKNAIELLEGIASAVNGEHNPFPQPWPYRYRVLEPSRGAKIIADAAPDGTLTVVPQEEVADRIVAWMRLHMNPDWFVNVRKAMEAVEMFKAIATPIQEDEIKPIRWLSDPGYTWRRLPWDQHNGPTPTWDEFLGRLSNAPAFRAFIGSMLFNDAKQHQYLWIYGMGSDGKGSINRWIEKLFGPTYRSKQPPAPGDKFWTYGLIGARAVVFPDCNAKAFVASGLFKSLTGGDAVDVEAKHRMSFTVRLMSKFVFLSNQRPTLSSQKADMRRIVYCEFSDEAQEQPGFEDRLWDEGGAFLSRCVKEYLDLCPNHTSIPTNMDEIQDWVSVIEEEFEAFFDAHFQIPVNPLYRTSAGVQKLDLNQISLVTVSPTTLGEILERHSHWDRTRQAEFRDWMKKKYGVDKKSIRTADVTTAVDGRITREAGSVVKAYVGVSLKNGKSSKFLRLLSTSSTETP